MVIGQGYKKWLTLEEQEALAEGCNALIDSLFDEYCKVEVWKPKNILATKLGKYLPKQYLLNYTPLFFKKFGICIIVVAWKLAQPKPLPLASRAEQLAAWAIVEEAKEILKRKNQETSENETGQAFQAFLNGYFEDANFFSPFDTRSDRKKTNPANPIGNLTSLEFENWFHPFSHAQKHITHPYTSEDGTHVGQAYKQWLASPEQEALAVGIDMLIDEIFEDFTQMESRDLEDIAWTTLASHLPRHHLPKYTPQFLKQFSVCIITVAWKLAQPKRLKLSSVAEELATWAILEEARNHLEMEQEEDSYQPITKDAFEETIDMLFEDTDFLLLFDDQYDGIETSMVGQLLHMTSLAFRDWLRPFTDEPELLPHPYTFNG